MVHFIDLMGQCIPGPGSAQVLEEVKTFISKRSLLKNEFLLQPGDVCSKVSFVTKGVCIKYRIKDGKEEVIEFYTGEMLTGDYVSFINREPSDQYVKALEDCEVEQISREDILQLFGKHPLMERAGRILSEKIYCKVITRMISYQNDSPEVRYQKLLEERPDLFQRVPQYLIASYLGVTPVGLSKIRKRLQDTFQLSSFIKPV